MKPRANLAPEGAPAPAPAPAPDPAPEQAADLARLEAAAALVDADDPSAAAPEPAPGVDPVESLAGLLGLMRGAELLGFRRLAAVWSDDACMRLAGAAVPVLRKYPWGGRVLAWLESGTGAEELGLLLVALPLAAASVRAARADAAELEGGPEPAAMPEPGPAGQVAELGAAEATAEAARAGAGHWTAYPDGQPGQP